MEEYWDGVSQLCPYISVFMVPQDLSPVQPCTSKTSTALHASCYLQAWGELDLLTKAQGRSFCFQVLQLGHRIAQVTWICELQPKLTRLLEAEPTELSAFICSLIYGSVSPAVIRAVD